MVSDQILSNFQRFVTEARPLVLGSAHQDWLMLRQVFSSLQPWRIVHDLLKISGMIYDETAYTDLMAWALNPSTHPPSARTRQLGWLEGLGITTANLDTVAPLPYFAAQDGSFPDLVLSYSNRTVVIELKTGSEEHLTPSGLYQTEAYPKAVKETLGLGDDHIVHMVFLTPDRCSAKNPEAILASFLEFALSLSEALRNESLPGDLRFAFSLLITHLATCALPSIVEEPLVDKLFMASDDIDDGFLLSTTAQISAMKDLFPEDDRVSI